MLPEIFIFVVSNHLLHPQLLYRGVTSLPFVSSSGILSSALEKSAGILGP